MAAYARCLVQTTHGKTLSGDFASTVLNAQQGTIADLRACRLTLQYPGQTPSPDLHLAPSATATSSTAPLALWLGDREIATKDHIAAALVNLGTGARIYSGAGLRTIVSSDASIAITESDTVIDLSVVPSDAVTSLFSNPGATSPTPRYSILKEDSPVTGDVELLWLADDTSINGGIEWTRDATGGYIQGKANVELENVGPGNTLAAGGITLKSLSEGTGIALTPSATDIVIDVIDPSPFTAFGPENRFGTIRNINRGNFLMGNVDYAPVSQTDSVDCSVLSSTGAYCVRSTASSIIASDFSYTVDTGGYRLKQCGMIATQNCVISAGSYTQNVINSAIVGSRAVAIYSATHPVNNSVVIGSNTCTVSAMNESAIVASSNSIMANTSSKNVILSGGGSLVDGSRITGDQPHNVVVGRACHSSGGHAFTCNLSSTDTLVATTAGCFTVKAPGGYVLYSNASGSIGMTMAPNGSSWVAVSDRNRKDIQREADYSSYLGRLAHMPIYEYNYKGASPDQRCVGPVAQDYHALFGCAAKDPLGIEQQDLIGICLAAIKALGAQVAELKTQLAELKALLVT